MAGKRVGARLASPRSIFQREAMEHCFAPVVGPDARVLILGSLPGVQSLAQQRYYAHPRNQFWRLVGAVIERDLMVLDYRERLEALRIARIGLWDTVAAATRRGSLDADIRLHQASDIEPLASDKSELRAIAFNGGTAARIGRRQIGSANRLALIDLPSSSPAYTASFDTKLQAWLKLREFL